MSNLVRFHDWLFDKDHILLVEIKSSDGKNYDHDTCAKVNHLVIVKLKNDARFELLCTDLYDARKELNYLTARTDASLTGPDYKTYIIQAIYQSRDYCHDLQLEVHKLMKSYKKIKDKVNKQ